MGDLPKALEEAWELKHMQDAEKAFEDAASGKTFSAGPSFFETAKVDEPAVAAAE